MVKWKKIMISIAALTLMGVSAIGVYAAGKLNNEEDMVIADGVYIGDIDVSGMTKEEAKQIVEQYIDALSGSSVSMMVGENAVEVPVSQLGFQIRNKEVYDEAVGLGKKGNVVKRYKDTRSLEKEGHHYSLSYQFDENAVRQVIETQCKAFEQPAVNAGLKRTGGGFQITGGSVGLALDVEQSVRLVMDFLKQQWTPENTAVALAVVQTEPKGTAEELGKVKDLLATATTSYSTSGENRCGNVERGASLINGTVLYPGEEFSAYQTVSPITVENGYFMAASYAEGQVVESPGGGICQVSTTLYNAVLKAELEVTARSNHSMIVTYVDPARDAAIAGTYKDLKFVNNTEAPIYIEGITAGKKITFNIYGMETRSSSRTVEFISETLEEIEPETQIVADGASPFGNISSQSPHKGIVAKLWKVVKENGVEVSRTEVNKSKYAMSPKKYTVGTANGKPEALAELNAAIGTKDINAVKAVIGKYASVTDEGTPVDEDTAAEGPVAGDPAPQPAEPAAPDPAPAGDPAQQPAAPAAPENAPAGDGGAAPG